MNNNLTVTPEDLLAHGAWLERLARRLCDPASADDLVQETWATAVRAKPDRGQPLRPWLGEVLRNLVKMRARKRGRWQARFPQLQAGAPGSLPSPEELLTYHEAQRLVAEAVAKLDEPYRSTVLLCYAQEISPTEIARQQNIPAGTVRWRLKRGLDELRAMLDRQYGSNRWGLILAPLTAPVVRAGGLGAAALGAVNTVGVFGGRAGSAKIFGAALAAALALALGLAAPSFFADKPRDPARQGVRNQTTLLRPVNPPPKLAVAPAPANGGPTPPAGAPPPAAAAVAALPVASTPAEMAEAVRRANEPGDSPTRGNPNAPVVIAFWGEFQCPFSARAVATLRELESAYPDKIRIVWKHLPLPFHEAALLAAEAAMAAHEQGKFWPMYGALFARQDRLDPAALETEARALGLDMPKFKAALDGGKFRKRIEADSVLAKEAKIAATPTFLINGERLMGAQPLPAFKQHVQAALAKAQGLPPPPAPAAAAGPPRPASPAEAIAQKRGNPYWPPASYNLPDALLGDRVKVRFVTGNAPVRGNPKGPVEVVHFTPLGLFEGRMKVEGLLGSHGNHVRLIAKVIPRRAPGGGEPVTELGEAGLYAHAQGKFWEFHDEIATGGPPDRARIDQVASKIGLDVADLGEALASGRFRASFEEEKEALKAAGINDLTFLVEGRRAESGVALAQLVETAIRKAGRRPTARPSTPPPPPIDPALPNYNPFALMSQLSPRQIFALEPRDEVWAKAVEKQLAPMFEADLRAVEPKVAHPRVECHATICRLSWQAGKGDETALRFLTRQLYTGLDGVPRDGEVLARWRSQPNHSAEETIGRLKSRRSTILYNHRTGRSTAKLPFPPERLPKE